ncbi:MAG TPA: translation initiation factor IF-2 [Candidatus Micrarchaeia archaeon]|nr:translation initiation factor IF-2 [Candidatus Micrarchaeia archaeon]
MKQVALPPRLTVKELGQAFGVAPAEVSKALLQHRILASINQNLEFATARLLAEQFGVEVVPEAAAQVTGVAAQGPVRSAGDEAQLTARPPVVTVLGHVDHGKTSLLDAIRHTQVAAGEAGGITQRIGASTVTWEGRSITFVDTPGHEAFTAMRARGANVTDVAVLVVAANDGIMPQTDEAIQHARAAGVPLIVAINKMDLDDANPDRVKQQLTERQLVVEEYGGDVVAVPVSARSGEGIPHLLEMILLVADLLEPRANPDRAAAGTVIDAHLDRGQGPLATVLVQDGTLRLQDHLVVGTIAGRVRAMVDDHGRKVRLAGPSQPVVISGLPAVVRAGDRFEVVAGERAARVLAEGRRLATGGSQAPVRRMSLADLSRQGQGTVRDLGLVVKADSQGALEALRGVLLRFADPTVRLGIVLEGVGPITEDDVNLAAAAQAIVVGFNVRPDANARQIADRAHVDVRTYDVVYHLSEDIERAIRGLHEPTFEEVFSGRAEVRARIRVPKSGFIAGSHVVEGRVVRDGVVSVRRDGREVHRGRIASLRRFKDDVREVAEGYDCGIDLGDYQDFQEGDLLEVSVVQQRNA